MVVAPTDAGMYPVVVFLHGTDLKNRAYTSLLEHVASHGFIVVAPQLYAMTFTLDDSDDIDKTKKVTNWLADPDTGLLHALQSKKFHGVEPDLNKLALAGHSRGGHTAFATALGLGHAKPPTELKLVFRALIGVDPVAGLSSFQMEPKVLKNEPRCLDLKGVPVLVVGTGLSPQPCAPTGLNHAEFYNECTPPRYHFDVADYGHLDMLNDGTGIDYLVQDVMSKCFCNCNKDGPKDPFRRTIGGLVVAFLRATLQGDRQDLEAILQNKGLDAPAKLDQVEYDRA